MDSQDLNLNTSQIDEDKSALDLNRKEIVGETDVSATLKGYELESEKKIVKEYSKDTSTIMDETLRDIMKNTLNFITYSGDNYMKKVYEVDAIGIDKEGKKGKKETSVLNNKYLLGFAMFCMDGNNAIYLGIVLLFVSLIIYFMSIVSTNEGVSRDP